MIESLQHHETEPEINDSAKARFVKLMRSETFLLFVLLGLVVLVWLPRLSGPIDLRWDGSVYYILGTSLAEGKGYKLLNEPGEIDAVQYPPLLPLVIAGHQLILGTNDPTTVGQWLRFSAFIIFIVYIYAVFKFFQNYLSLHTAFLATILCLFSLHVYFLSDLCYPEILFGLTTILFILWDRQEEKRANSILIYVFAVMSYALRTIGIAVFAVWILESLFKKKFKQAAWRVILALIPVACWQFYIASVESSYEYNHPAYVYQRAPYMFSNVSYARNIALRDPLTPEEDEKSVSPAEVARRFIHNAIRLPANFGETVTVLKEYPDSWLKLLFGETRLRRVLQWSAFLFLYTIGLFVLGGLALHLLWRRKWIVPLYVLALSGLICLTPFPAQFARYLMPAAPFLVLFLIVFLLTLKSISERFLPSRWSSLGKYFSAATLSVVLLTELLFFVWVFAEEHQQIAYTDKNNRYVEHRLLFDTERQRDFDLCITYIAQNAKPDDVAAAGIPHWIYLRTGLKSVMPPFKKNPVVAQELLDSVPVSYLVVGTDVIKSEQYTLPVVKGFPEKWNKVYAVPDSEFAVYRRVAH